MNQIGFYDKCTFFFKPSSLFNVRDLQLIAPELILTVVACVALVMEVILPYRLSKWTAYFSLVGIALALVSLGALFMSMGGTFRIENITLAPLDGFYGMVRIDGFALLFKAIFLIAAALAVAISIRYLDHRTRAARRILRAGSVRDGRDDVSRQRLRSDFALHRTRTDGPHVLRAGRVHEAARDRSNEAGMKYFLLGAFSSGILFTGCRCFMASRAQRISESDRKKSQPDAGTELRPLLLLGMIALAAGLFFKVAAVPFHMWAPDAYEGAPTSVTAFLSTGSKAASFALYARIFFVALAPMQIDWAPLLGIVAALTIVVGNWAAITQENSKRLLAYSSISNAGYLLLGLVANNTYGNIGLVIYLFVYTLMNMGAFGVIISLRRRGIIGDNVDDMTGLAQKAPGMAAMMAIFMLSLGGLPGTGGFIGKYFLLWGLLPRGDADSKSWYYWLAGWAVINIVVSFYYYIRFIA